MLGPTHWRVLSRVREEAEFVRSRQGGTWNTYQNHPTGYWLDDVSVDHWGPGGRGDPVGAVRGEQIKNLYMDRRAAAPLAWIIWNGWWWRPGVGWARYPGWLGSHWDHVHVTKRLFSYTAGKWPQP